MSAALAVSAAGAAQAQQAGIVEAQAAAADRQREATMTAMTASIQKQVSTIRKEKEVQARFFVMDPVLPQPAIEPDCDALSEMQVYSLSNRAAAASHIDSNLVRAVMRQESAFRPCATSAKGAQGLMQLMPGTASDLGVNNAYDPEENAFAGARLLRSLLDRYAGDLNRTLGAYNAGPARVDEANGIPPFPETRTYVDNILRNLDSAVKQ